MQFILANKGPPPPPAFRRHIQMRRIGDKSLSEPMLAQFTYAYMRH